VAATECRGCGVNIGAITPLVPIIPDLLADVHRMWQAYNGFTFAFNDYLDAGLAPWFDGEKMALAWNIIDPIHFVDRLEKIPKFVTVSSDDEFMMMDWTSLYWDQLKGEKHLLIAPNTEHVMVTGIWDILSSMTTNIRSAMLGVEKRSTFSYDYDKDTGALTVTVPLD
jgi:PhoPQ-activated pathogenicity-related protein